MLRRPNALLLIVAFIAAGASPALAQDQSSEDEGLDIRAIEQVLGRKGAMQGNEFKVTVPQNDLNVTVDGFTIIPPMGMGSWAAFTPTADGAMIMGDIVVLEDEIAPVQQQLIEHSLTVTGLHNHFVREEPDVMYMHIAGTGEEVDLASGVKAVLDEIARLRGRDPSAAAAENVENALDTERISEILGHTGELNRGVYKITIGRPDVDLHSRGAAVSTFMGFNTWASWQGSPDHAAVAGDFTMLEDEVAPIIEALVMHGIEVVAVHNHMVHEEPRTFFLHYWGTGPAEDLARGLKAALDQIGR